MYEKYIGKYGNFSHILNIEIDKSVSEDEKHIILYDIYDLINEKDIKKNISNIILLLNGGLMIILIYYIIIQAVMAFLAM